MKNKLKFKMFERKSVAVISIAISLLVILPVLGFYMSSSSLTDYYYYQNKPMHLNIRTDKIFIKTKQQLSKEELTSVLSVYSQIAPISRIDENEKMQFISLTTQNTTKALNDLVFTLNQNPQIEYSSVVYSPFDGGGNKVLQGLTNEILVQFKQGTQESRISEYLKLNQFEIVQTLSLSGGISYVLKVSKNLELSSLDAANMVYNSGLVNWSEPNFYYSGLLQSAPNDVFFPRQWSIKNTGNNIPEGISGTAGCDMRVDSAWNISTGVSKCIVGMVDSGIDTTHEDIKANLINSKGYDFINNHPLQTDDMNHGTCTGGIVGAVQNNTIGISGIAPNVKLIGIKIFNSAGSTTTAALTNGLIYSWQQGEWISSNSWGGGSPVSAADQAILDGVTLGRGGKGTIFCVATGNSNGALQWPSTNPNVIAVGGNTPCNTRKSTSSCDGETWWGANYGTGISIVAPCVKVYATDRMGSVGYTGTNYDSTFNGTSSATPNCAGVVALSLSLDSTQRWDSVRVRLCRTADKIGTYTYTSTGPYSVLGSTWNNEMGYGKVNAYKLLKLNQQLLGPTITHTPLGNTEQISSTRAVNCTITPANSGINPSTVKLYYAKNSTSWSNVTMTNAGGTNWTTNLPLSGAGTYNYYLTATDSASKIGTSPTGAPASYHSFIASADTVRPIITHTAIGNTPKLAWPVTVTATVTDNIGVDSAWVRWKKGSAGVTKRFKLLFVSGNTYSAPFNSIQSEVIAGDTIFYRIIAQDNSSGHNKDSTTQYSFSIISQATACIGTGSVAMGNDASPFNTYWYGARTNILFTAAEILANQGGAGQIVKIGFQISAVGSPSMTGLNIRMQATTLTSLSAFVSSGWTTVYSGNYTPPGTGWQYIDLATPFVWNGTSNLLVEVCFGNTSYTTATTVLGTTATNMYRTEYHDLSTACAYTGFTAGTNYTARANTCFVINTQTGLNSNIGMIPKTYSLNQNYPNPFNPVTRINFAIPKQGLVSLKVYDVLGREVKSLVNEVKAPGEYSVDFSGTELSSGVYFYKLESNGFSDIKKMMLIK
jgi:subtilisin family serine protease